MNAVKNTLIVIATVAVVIFVIVSAVGIYGAWSLNSEGYVYNPADGRYYAPNSDMAQAIKMLNEANNPHGRHGG